MTMVELLVAMFIGVGVTLVVATLLVAGENHKRTTTSTNDADQTGAYAFYALERYLSGAGSAIAASASSFGSSIDAGVLGCKLNVTSILPAAAFPAPFANVLGGATSTLRVAPVLIGSGQSAGGDPTAGASDVLIIMGGAGTGGGISRPVVSAGTTSPPSLQLESAEGFKPYDYVILSQSGLATPSDCLLEEVANTANQASTTPTPPLVLQSSATAGNPYYTAGTSTTLSSLVGSPSTYVTGLGNVAANDFQYQMIGVGSPDTLYSYDLLQYQKQVQSQTIGASSQAIADGVVAMYALYGVATAATGAGAGIFAYWVDPGGTGGFDITSVMNSETKMERIVAVRVGVIVRGEYYDKNIVSQSPLTVFSTLGKDGITNASLTKSVTLSPTQQHYRYRTFEFTVPLRNMLILAGTS